MKTHHLWKRKIWETLQKNIQSVGLESCCMTLGLTGPSCRTVVFRGFAGVNHCEELGWDSDCIIVTTDKRSKKMQAIAQDPNYEICWYMRGTQEQFRLRGQVYTYPPINDNANANNNTDHLPIVERKLNTPLPNVDDVQLIGNKAFTLLCQKNHQTFSWEAERRRQFALLEDVTRATFSTKTPPSKNMPITGLDENAWFISPNQQEFNDAYENFSILIFTVKEMDYLSLTTGEHKLYKVEEHQQQ
ncbi:unnamed protein product [Cunninghamella blakesleeana]